jgi:hypothetical protein
VSGLLSFFGILLAIVCMAFPAHVAPRIWATLVALSMLLTLAGISNFPQ